MERDSGFLFQSESNSIHHIAEKLQAERIECACGISLKCYSTFRIGGLCDLAVFPKSKNELSFAIGLLKLSNIKFDVIGCGSNVLFCDEGYRGALVFMSQMRHIQSRGSAIHAAAGTNLTAVSIKAARMGLSGLEFACGIPGSCGGAVCMNAGAYGGEISDVLEYSEYYDVDKNEFFVLNNAEHKFSYRNSIYIAHKNMIVTEVGFRLVPDNAAVIKERMDENATKRKMSQPHEYPNAGSIFKRPTSGFAAKMIDECGLKGLSVGDAQISEKHAGFIVNKGAATSSDVNNLISIIRERVSARFGVDLECEIHFIK